MSKYKRTATNIPLQQVINQMRKVHGETTEKTKDFINKNLGDKIEMTDEFFYKTFIVKGEKTEFRLWINLDRTSTSKSNLTEK